MSLMAVIAYKITPTTDALTRGITMLPLAMVYFRGGLFSAVAQMTNRMQDL